MSPEGPKFGRPPEVNGLAHAAYAKAHFLSGRPGAGLEILHRMVASGAGEDGHVLAVWEVHPRAQKRTRAI